MSYERYEYIKKYIYVCVQAQQKGTIGIKNDCMWYEPLTNSTADKEAAQRGLEFWFGW